MKTLLIGLLVIGSISALASHDGLKVLTEKCISESNGITRVSADNSNSIGFACEGETAQALYATVESFSREVIIGRSRKNAIGLSRQFGKVTGGIPSQCNYTKESSTYQCFIAIDMSKYGVGAF